MLCGVLAGDSFLSGICVSFAILCHERHATVHLTQKALGQPDRRRDLCEVCFPLNTSQEEQSEMMRRLFKNQPPDEPDGSKDNDHAA
jgi:hypothetical protein